METISNGVAMSADSVGTSVTSPATKVTVNANFKDEPDDAVSAPTGAPASGAAVQFQGMPIGDVDLNSGGGGSFSPDPTGVENHLPHPDMPKLEQTHEGEYHDDHGEYGNVGITNSTYLFAFCAALNSCNLGYDIGVRHGILSVAIARGRIWQSLYVGSDLDWDT